MGQSVLKPVIIRSRRKTLSLIIMPDGQIVVRAPLHTPDQLIEAVIIEKRDWIHKKQQSFLERNARQRPIHQYLEGEEFLYLGSAYSLHWVDRSSPRLTLEDRRFCLSLDASKQARDIFMDWYRTQAREVFTMRAAEYGKIMGLQHKALRISSARTRWGSCSSLGTLSFTWRLVLAPLPIIDYVVVHELAHLKEANHSKRFWQIVKSILPDYGERLTWLRANGHLLQFN